MALCTLATLNIWSKWNQNPVIVTFDDKTTHVASCAFPSITICPIQKFGPQKISVTLANTLREISAVDISLMGNYFFQNLTLEE